VHREYQPVSHDHHTGAGRIRWRRLLVFALFAASAAYAMMGVYTVGPDEQAVVRRFGEALPQLRGPGLHFAFPGFERVDRIKLLQSRRVGVGVALTERTLGRRIEPQRAEGLTGDRNLILISAVVQYHVADVHDYLFRTDDVAALVESVAASALSSAVASMSVDDVLTVKRTVIRHDVLRACQEALDRYEAGVTVTSVTLEGLSPPQEVAHAFRDVNSAREDRQTTINAARAYASQILPQAESEARQTLLQAEADAGQLTQQAQGNAQHFGQIAAELAGNRELTARRLIVETMEEVLPRLKKIVLGADVGRQIDLELIEEGK